ncbi:hypothetical protein BBK36DRAFT_1171728 [Trichoderma citrinoviride]|uniref:Endosomal spry domain-containing protein n=1 Tax=Trichoderma citrinoviride TaxID=58853 RepID=A0A2T4B2F6_9HYPO|nr:hypothetical protein BBK36DRAFT_1171728 [Trichoderma citrinoviride]PTB63513.1 hypothetical protein BBK36DRAFT_1171728 [Trichoderma citrinoviride]
MAPAVASTGRDLTGTPTVDLIGSDQFPADGPLLHGARLLARQLSKRTEDPSKGVLDPHDINNAGFFFLFALIGVGFVVTGIWFFFYAKNGGIYFKDNDWDDYKSTVLRRRGPNGTVLSGATESTDLGGGSVYKRYDDHDHDEDDDRRTAITDSTYLTGITAGASDIFAREKRKKKREARDAERRKRRGDKGKSTDTSSTAFEGVVDEKAEREAKKLLRSYRHEKAARVGGINKEAEGSEWEGSTNAAESSVGATSELLLHQEPTPTSSPTKASAAAPEAAAAASPEKKPAKSGIRKVYSTADRRESREAERLRAEARRLRAADKIAARDFGYQRAAGAVTNSELSESLLSGSGSGGGSTTLGESIPEEDSEMGTKSYHHPLPELKEQRRREREERRARRSKSGYRRGNTEETDL